MSAPRVLFADFQLLDAIKQFGEKRYVESAPSNLQAGPLRLHPSIRTQVQYDDNIFLSEEDEDEGVIFNVRPGAIIELPFSRHQLAVGYEADIEVFSKSRHASQNDQNQNFFALADLHFASGYINILEKFRETSSRAGTTFTSRIPRIDQSVHPKIGFRWKRLIFEGGFRHFLRDYRRTVDNRRDFQTFDWTGIIYYDLFARLKALIEYQFTKIDYDSNFTRNGGVNQVRAGLDGEIWPNFHVRFKGGIQFRDYEASAEPDFNSWIADLHVDYEMRKNLTFNLALKREAVEATFSNVNFYVKHLIGFGAEYYFLPRWALFGRGRYYRNDYRERATRAGQTGFRRDHHLSARVGVRYEPRPWWEVELTYSHFRLYSNFETFDYIDNRFSLSSAIHY